METAAPAVADRPFSHGAEKTSKPQPFREREGLGTRKCQISRSELTNWSGIIELRVFVNKNAKGLATLYDVVGSVKRHLQCASYGQLVFVLT